MATKRTAKKELTQEQMAFLEKRRRLRQAQQVKDEEEAHVPIDIFNSQPPLGIFSIEKIEKEQSNQQVKLTMWDKCKEREMKILSLNLFSCGFTSFTFFFWAKSLSDASFCRCLLLRVSLRSCCSFLRASSALFVPSSLSFL